MDNKIFIGPILSMILVYLQFKYSSQTFYANITFNFVTFILNIVFTIGIVFVLLHVLFKQTNKKKSDLTTFFFVMVTLLVLLIGTYVLNTSFTRYDLNVTHQTYGWYLLLASLVTGVLISIMDKKIRLSNHITTLLSIIVSLLAIMGVISSQFGEQYTWFYIFYMLIFIVASMIQLVLYVKRLIS